jgi:hypothetical protein
MLILPIKPSISISTKNQDLMRTIAGIKEKMANGWPNGLAWIMASQKEYCTAMEEISVMRRI